MGKRIEICGGIASGKTTLAHILEAQGFTAVYERFEDNPFLNEFYTKTGENNIFETEAAFALLHYNQIKGKLKAHKLVCDYSLFQDFCYAVNNLDESEMSAFGSLYEFLIKQISLPDIIIYLKCDTGCLQDRIRRRNRGMEMTITADYLQSNIDTIERYLEAQKNVLMIESDKYDFTGRDQKDTVDRILRYCSSWDNIWIKC